MSGAGIVSAAKRAKRTEMVELVETHNLVLALQRIQNQAGRYDNERWKRSLYHALGMTGVGTQVLERVRIALGLP